MPGVTGDANGVDLNTANRQQLEKVGGLGPDRATSQQLPLSVGIVCAHLNRTASTSELSRHAILT